VQKVTADISAMWRPMVGAVHHCARGLERAGVWTESMAHLVDRLHTPKGYLILAIKDRSNGLAERGGFPHRHIV
jgi:hypothetical protein